MRAASDRAGPLGLFPGRPTPRLYDSAIEAMRVRHYSRRTEEAYVDWISRLILFDASRHPRELADGDNAAAGVRSVSRRPGSRA